MFIVAHEDEISTNQAFQDANQVICRQLVKVLSQRYKENKDKVKIVPVGTVYAYLRDHHNWIAMSKQEIGKHFDADFVVYVELGPMTALEPRSSGTLYRGNVEYRIAVIDTHQTDGETKFEKVGTTTTDERAVTEITRSNFQALFLERVAKDLSRYFISYQSQDKMADNQ